MSPCQLSLQLPLDWGGFKKPGGLFFTKFEFTASLKTRGFLRSVFRRCRSCTDPAWYKMFVMCPECHITVNYDVRRQAVPCYWSQPCCHHPGLGITSAVTGLTGEPAFGGRKLLSYTKRCNRAEEDFRQTELASGKMLYWVAEP